MIIDDKALMKLMKEAKKSFGYHVAVFRSAGNTKNIIIAADTGRWAVVMEQKNAPRKVLGLIVEHMGTLPSIGECYLVRKKDAQSEMPEIVTGMLSDIADTEKPQLLIAGTPLYYGGYQLWQRTEDMRIFKVDPELCNLLILPTNEAKIIGNSMIKAEDLESRGYITVNHDEDSRNVWLEHLSQIEWAKI
ncbi:MAG: hypothetical protein IIV13_00845 [Bacteroidaceae bacterium]|nr:hypothetical protein [Bacteroidaceae bacterium]